MIKSPLAENSSIKEKSRLSLYRRIALIIAFLLGLLLFLLEVGDPTNSRNYLLKASLRFFIVVSLGSYLELTFKRSYRVNESLRKEISDLKQIAGKGNDSTRGLQTGIEELEDKISKLHEKLGKDDSEQNLQDRIQALSKEISRLLQDRQVIYTADASVKDGIRNLEIRVLELSRKIGQDNTNQDIQTTIQRLEDEFSNLKLNNQISLHHEVQNVVQRIENQLLELRSKLSQFSPSRDLQSAIQELKQEVRRERELREAEQSRQTALNSNLREEVQRMREEKVSLSRKNFSDAEFAGIKLECADLRYCNFHRADLTKAKLNEVDLSKANLSKAKLSGAELERSQLNGADLSEANLIEAQLTKANLYEACLFDARLSSANFSGANLRHTDLIKAYLPQAVLNNADLTGAKLIEATLIGTKLSNAVLREADLSKAKLNEANMEKANLKYASLNKAQLDKAKLNEADLSNANLSGANLRGSDISGTNFEYADLSGANLSNIVFNEKTIFRKAKFEGAIYDSELQEHIKKSESEQNGNPSSATSA